MPTQGNHPSGRARDVFAERYARNYERLSPAFKRVAAFIDANRIEVMSSSALKLAREIGTSDATVVRAVQALGFEGLYDLRMALAASYGGKNAPSENLTRTWAEIGEGAEAAMDEVLDAHAAGLEALRAPPLRSAMTEALKLLHGAERIVVFGLGPTAHIAAYFAARVRRKGRKQLLLDRTGSGLADQLLDLERGDVLLMMAYGKLYREAELAMFEARRLQLPVILITDVHEALFTRHAATILRVPRGRIGRVALHGATLACLEMMILGLATTNKDAAMATLERLERFREATRPTRQKIGG